MHSIVKAGIAVLAIANSANAFKAMSRHHFFNPTNKLNKKSNLASTPNELPESLHSMEYLVSAVILTMSTFRSVPLGPGKDNLPVRTWMFFYQVYFNILSYKKDDNDKNVITVMSSEKEAPEEFDDCHDDEMVFPLHDDSDNNADFECRNSIALYLSFVSTLETIRGTTHFAFEKIYEGIQSVQVEPDHVTMNLF